MIRRIGKQRRSLSDEGGEVERLLELARFRPRESLGAELMGRVRRGEKPSLVPGRAWFAGSIPWLAGAGVIMAMALFTPERAVRVDRCCYDLDGGGPADDGVEILAERNGRVRTLAVYEDRDGSHSLSMQDVVRFRREGEPLLDHSLPTGFTRIRHCCQDLDGGGPPDDGLLVIADPPDRVHTAAIYELR